MVISALEGSFNNPDHSRPGSYPELFRTKDSEVNLDQLKSKKSHLLIQTTNLSLDEKFGAGTEPSNKLDRPRTFSDRSMRTTGRMWKSQPK